MPKTKLYDGSEEGEAFLKLWACIWRYPVHFLTFYGLGAIIYMLGVPNDIKLPPTPKFRCLIEVVVACYGRKSRFADASAQYFYSLTELCQGSLSTIMDGSETRVWIMGFCQWLKFYGFSEVMQVTVYHRFTGSIGSQGEKSVRNCIESRGISQILSRRVRFTLWPLEQLGWWGWGSNTDWTTTQ